MTYPVIARGSKLGIHSTSSNPGPTIPTVQAAHDRGAPLALVLAESNGGVALDVKRYSPQTLTITRLINSNPEWEAFQGGYLWTATQTADFARGSVQQLLGRLNADERAAADWLSIINEASPKGHYREFGLALVALCDEATARGVRLAIPALNAGTPEWDEMQQLVASGLFQAMKAGSHILSIHEGVQPPGSHGPQARGTIPGAPSVAGAGPLCWRYRYLLHLLRPLGLAVPIVVSEYYSVYDDVNLALSRWAEYDAEVRRDPEVLGVCAFTAGPGTWTGQDIAPMLPGLIEYVVREKDVSNSAGLPPTPPLVDRRARGVFVSAIQDPAAMEFGYWRGDPDILYGWRRVCIGLNIDASAPAHYTAMQSAGMMTGITGVLHEAADPAAQARLMVSLRQPLDRLPDMLDAERAGVTEAMLRAYCDEHDRITTWLLIVYTGPGWWDTHVPAGARVRYVTYDLSIAGYPFDTPPQPDGRDVQPMDPVSVALRSTPPAAPRQPALPAGPWDHWDDWQHSGHGSLPGYSKFMNLHVYNGTPDDMRARWGEATPLPVEEAELSQTQIDAIKAETARARAALAAIDAALEPPPWWETLTLPHKLPVQNRVINFYTAAGAPFSPPLARTVTYQMDAWERNGDLLRVTQLPPAGTYSPRENWWVKALELTPP